MPEASVGVQMTLAGDVCQDLRVALGSAGLTPIHATAAEGELRGKSLSEATIDKAAEAAVVAMEALRGEEMTVQALQDRFPV